MYITMESIQKPDIIIRLAMQADNVTLISMTMSSQIDTVSIIMVKVSMTISYEYNYTVSVTDWSGQWRSISEQLGIEHGDSTHD